MISTDDFHPHTPELPSVSVALDLDAVTAENHCVKPAMVTCEQPEVDSVGFAVTEILDRSKD